MSLQTFRQQLGHRSEELAARYLRARGYTILKANVRFPVGEIDLVARQGEVLCFVEVRSASSTEWGGPLATVTYPKQQRLIRAAQWYLKRLRALPPQIRFDVIAITWRTDGTSSVELIPGAFDAPSW